MHFRGRQVRRPRDFVRGLLRRPGGSDQGHRVADDHGGRESRVWGRTVFAVIAAFASGRVVLAGREGVRGVLQADGWGSAEPGAGVFAAGDYWRWGSVGLGVWVRGVLTF